MSKTIFVRFCFFLRDIVCRLKTKLSRWTLVTCSPLLFVEVNLRILYLEVLAHHSHWGVNRFERCIDLMFWFFHDSVKMYVATVQCWKIFRHFNNLEDIQTFFLLPELHRWTTTPSGPVGNLSINSTGCGENRTHVSCVRLFCCNQRSVLFWYISGVFDTLRLIDADQLL